MLEAHSPPGERETRSPLWKKIALIPMGGAIGLLIGWLAYFTWATISPGPRDVTSDDFPDLRQMLDDDVGPGGLYRFDETLGYQFKRSRRGIRHGSDGLPHQTNTLGLLGDREVKSIDSVSNVLCLGDSVTYGDGIAFERIFVSLWQDRAGDTRRFFNGACPGWNLAQSLAFFQRDLAEYDWDAVVLCVCLNDFVDFGWGWTADRGYQWTMLESRMPEARTIVSNLRAEFERESSTRGLALHDDATLLSWEPGRIAASLSSRLEAYQRDESAPPLIVVVLPTRHQFDALNAGAPRDLVRVPQRFVTESCREYAVPCLDAFEAMRADSSWNAADLYQSNDALHFSEAGHQRLTDALWPELHEQLIALRSVSMPSRDE